MSALADLRFALVGAGRVGRSLARWLAARGADLVVVGARPGSAAASVLADELRARLVPLAELDSATVDLLLLAVSDNALFEVASALGERRQAAVALHTSGSWGAEPLAPLAAVGSATGSFHPLRAFPHSVPTPDAGGTVFALDGDGPAVALGERLACALGGVPVRVPAAVRPLYHLAATLAAGGVVTLLAEADHLRRRAGLPDEVRQGLFTLARGALAAAAAAPDAALAITGPAARGDHATVERQLAALATSAPEEMPLVRALLATTLRRRASAGVRSAAEAALAKRLEATDFLDPSGGGC